MQIDARIVVHTNGIYRTQAPGVAAELFSRLLGCTLSEAIRSFLSYSNLTLELGVHNGSTVKDLLFMYADKAHFIHERELFLNTVNMGTVCDRNMIIVEDSSLDLQCICPSLCAGDSANVLLVFPGDAGAVLCGEDPGITYSFHSREAGRHNVAHVHVDVRHTHSASISIETGEVLAGFLPQKDLKTVRSRIDKNKLYLLEQWNKQTDGIRIDLNYGMGLSKLI